MFRRTIGSFAICATNLKGGSTMTTSWSEYTKSLNTMTDIEMTTDEFLTYKAYQLGITPKQLRIMRFYECEREDCTRRASVAPNNEGWGWKRFCTVHDYQNGGIMRRQSPEQNNSL